MKNKKEKWLPNSGLRISYEVWGPEEEQEVNLQEELLDLDYETGTEYWDIKTPDGYDCLYYGDNLGDSAGNIHWEPNEKAIEMDILNCGDAIEMIEEGLNKEEALKRFNLLSKENYKSVVVVNLSGECRIGALCGLVVFGKKEVKNGV